MTKRPTIIDVAEAAGVSKSTVSLVLQDSPLVKDETRAKVRETMRTIGYVYNRAAANLRSANVGLIGLVINDLRNPFFTEFATSLQMALSARGYATVIANTDEDAGVQAQVVGSMVEHGVSGLVISPTYGGTEATFGPLQRAGIPVLQVLRQASGDTERFPFASFDYLSGGRAATRHLLDAGARRIAFVGGPEGRPITAERMAGYLAVLREAGMEPIILHGRSSRGFGREAALRLGREYPAVDAAVCFNDLVALGMIAGFAAEGRQVGREFRLVGFDDIEECAMVYPQLSSVRCNIAGFGRAAADTLVDWLEQQKHPVAVTRAPVELVVRASSGG
ncbi:MAG: LacI family DNA-binding transcriptional regulator [Tabrizicola sp.]|uniref:LacI family DNA-binding transcriptional regulator n=1 Tax=Tabrizicola sp. TaxID=2005166 RepID=UPI00273380C5|nr:LacI family DNA-binding transcriptional regulator [Tabrizicola sp.]MDP3264155.1 LacI family DNA-binding transcriptional regulator [Tabrizicola sp.]MDP3648784.1 LacI family DNA-binding transcriptional regulator [Paracoccaceae bacterium]MDZ4065506.1 LacI family DNA-binding transcriptional regulator [Tabrizicola sp.]